MTCLPDIRGFELFMHPCEIILDLRGTAVCTLSASSAVNESELSIRRRVSVIVGQCDFDFHRNVTIVLQLQGSGS
jgi:hypothetical protein